jgi:hypothetical protein
VLSVHGRGRLKRLYEHALKRFSVEMTEEDAALLADDYRVEFVEEDGIVGLDASQSGATLGPRPYRPAGPAPQPDLHVRPDGHRGPRLHPRHRPLRDARPVRRARRVLNGTDTTSPYTYAWDTTAATNASHSLVSKAVDTWNNMGTSTARLRNRQQCRRACGPRRQRRLRSTPWSFAGRASLTSGTSAHSGSAYALLGNRNRSNGTVSQSVTIPAGATAALTFWLSVTSNDSSASATDIISVEVVDAGVASLLGTFSNLNKGAARVYSMKTFSLANWRGKIVTLRFRATTNNKQPTSFSVDDV